MWEQGSGATCLESVSESQSKSLKNENVPAPGLSTPLLGTTLRNNLKGRGDSDTEAPSITRATEQSYPTTEKQVPSLEDIWNHPHKAIL